MDMKHLKKTENTIKLKFIEMTKAEQSYSALELIKFILNTQDMEYVRLSINELCKYEKERNELNKLR